MVGPARLAFALLLASSGAFGQTVAEVAAENWLPARPLIENYSDEAAFVADVLKWENARSLLAERIETGELPERPPAPARENDWHHVTGPEDLDTALKNAAGYKQPDYKEQLRFNRTTHLSFPLESLPAERLAEELIEPAEPRGQDQQTPLVMINDSGHLVLPPEP